MKLYLAAAYSNEMGVHQKIYRRLTPNGKLALDYCQDRLESYHYVTDNTVRAMRREPGRKVFLDSGAFSAFTQGVDIDVEVYAAFCRDHEDIIEVPSVLDVVGDAVGTWHNQKKLEDLGVNCLPCFHFGEPEEALKYYVENYEHMTIGGMVPISTPNLIRWLDRIWPEYLMNPDGSAKLKVHGFGLTSQDLMERYPWYSVDSSSWIQVSSFGSVFIPDYGTLAVSKQSPSRKNPNVHYDTLPSDAHRRRMDEIFEFYGFTYELLSEHYSERRAFCAISYALLADRITKTRQNRTYQPYLC